MRQPAQHEVIARLDRAFAPDLRVRVDDASTITGFTPVTLAGAQFLLQSAGEILGAQYDEAQRLAAGLTFEVSE